MQLGMAPLATIHLYDSRPTQPARGASAEANDSR
jgi:hypothetical protein